MIAVLEQFKNANPSSVVRMKPLDVVKVLMGIMSQRDSVKQFQWDGKFWASLQEYDYEELINTAEVTVKNWYLEGMRSGENKN